MPSKPMTDYINHKYPVAEKPIQSVLTQVNEILTRVSNIERELSEMRNTASRADLRDRGIEGTPTTLKLQFDVKKNDDGSYAEHKAKCVLVGHPRFLVEGIHYRLQL